MDLVAAFLAYAADFEKTVVDDDWTRLERHFTEDATYHVTGEPPLGGTWTGRDSVLRHLRESLAAFDRRFDRRRVEPIGEFRREAQALEIGWRGVYELAGAPDLELRGTERAEFAGGRIRRLEDRMEPGTDAAVQRYLAEHLR